MSGERVETIEKNMYMPIFLGSKIKKLSIHCHRCNRIV